LKKWKKLQYLGKHVTEFDEIWKDDASGTSAPRCPGKWTDEQINWQKLTLRWWITRLYQWVHWRWIVNCGCRFNVDSVYISQSIVPWAYDSVAVSVCHVTKSLM